MRIAKEGYPIILSAAILSVGAFAVNWKPIGLILSLLTLAIAAFFRDPERTTPLGEGLIVSPADFRYDPSFLRHGETDSICGHGLQTHRRRHPLDARLTANAKDTPDGGSPSGRAAAATAVCGARRRT